jgi:hypothetical protein
MPDSREYYDPMSESSMDDDYDAAFRKPIFTMSDTGELVEQELESKEKPAPKTSSPPHGQTVKLGKLGVDLLGDDTSEHHPKPVPHDR